MGGELFGEGTVFQSHMLSLKRNNQRTSLVFVYLSASNSESDLKQHM